MDSQLRTAWPPRDYWGKPAWDGALLGCYSYSHRHPSTIAIPPSVGVLLSYELAAPNPLGPTLLLAKTGARRAIA
jgi:hypothetical protein